MKRIRVLIVDDHPMVRQGLKFFLGVCDDIAVVDEASNGIEALRKIENLEPDVVLMDLMMPELDGIGVITELKKRQTQTKILVLTSFVDEKLVMQALRNGAVSYTLKDVSPRELVDAIRETSNGVPKLHPVVTQKLMKQVTDDDEDQPEEYGNLTEREQQVLDYLEQGLTNKEIAVMLHISIKTVKTHVANVMQKMGVTSRTQAALLGVKRKMNS